LKAKGLVLNVFGFVMKVPRERRWTGSILKKASNDLGEIRGLIAIV
jgi:hypothetical protein